MITPLFLLILGASAAPTAADQQDSQLSMNEMRDHESKTVEMEARYVYDDGCVECGDGYGSDFYDYDFDYMDDYYRK
ncbi:hypothetical protein DASB73_002650 [Starmerella bacillaris]|mgnify:FL=1|uniref:Uncharacterized protein n=1 Tax=Starmerella bacillaris TaxID=1247836 RepID=A0AAV5RDM3_STABA|nr:hypothetical protein DASB73_002650 [Starmerella bacillaris]